MIKINGKRITNPLAQGLITLLILPFLALIFLVIFGVIFPVIFVVILPTALILGASAVAVSLLFPNKKK